MAEFCPECWNKMNHSKKPISRYVLSSEPDLCEECGKWKYVIVRERNLIEQLFAVLREHTEKLLKKY